MADKYLSLGTNGKEEIEATVVSSGSANAGDIVALDATGRLDQSVMPVGIGPDTKSIEAYENLSAGDFVNIFKDTADLNKTKARKADATSVGKQADGFVLEAVTAGNNALVYFEGINNQLSGLDNGTKYFLSDSTPGGITSTIVTTSGHIYQYIGKAISSTELSFEGSDPIIRA